MRIMIVDECELSAGMLAVVLEVYGHQVRLIRNPGAASRLAADFHPDVVLLTVTPRSPRAKAMRPDSSAPLRPASRRSLAFADAQRTFQPRAMPLRSRLLATGSVWSA